MIFAAVYGLLLLGLALCLNFPIKWFALRKLLKMPVDKDPSLRVAGVWILEALLCIFIVTRVYDQYSPQKTPAQNCAELGALLISLSALLHYWAFVVGMGISEWPGRFWVNHAKNWLICLLLSTPLSAFTVWCMHFFGSNY